jgi:murein DD-endopeptidase MepM/ murein hydrolase activator NlpD
MSLTLLYRGKNVRFAMRLKKAHWLSALLCFALISGVVVYLFISINAAPTTGHFRDKIAEVNHSSIEHKQSTQNSTENYPENAVLAKQKTLALTIKLAELQSQILRLNALGERLASDANIPENEFDFAKLPPSGGPFVGGRDLVTKSFAQLFAEISLLQQQLSHEEKQLKALESLSLGHHISNSSYLSGRPIKKGWLSSYYGVRKDPFHGRPAMHKGIDFAGKEDADIIATASGVVSWASGRYGYGNLIEINHGGGLKTRYGHNKEILVNVGDVVEKGQIIAHMGSTGRSTGPHVHYEILKRNAQINPLKFVYRKAKK